MAMDRSKERAITTIDYEKYDFRSDTKNYDIILDKGLSEEVVKRISEIKNEPKWMLEYRLKALDIFKKLPMPSWGADLSEINFDEIIYYMKPSEANKQSWEDVPKYIKETFDRLGIPEAEKNFLGGVGAQYDSEVVYHSIREDLQKQGVVFLGMDQGLKEYEGIVKEHFGTVVPSADNKFAALNSCVWSGGSFVYVPPNVNVEIPLQAYFRINAQNMGQFERTLIIVDKNSRATYVEGCTAPKYSSNSLHAAVVEVIAKEGAHVRYTTIQNWANNIYNLVTKRAHAFKNSTVEWVDGNLGCLTGDSKIFLNNDVKEIKDVEVGDVVYSLTPEFGVHRQKILGKKVNPPREVFEITTENHRSLKATSNHPFLVLQKISKTTTISWKPLDQIKVSDQIAVSGNIPGHGFGEQIMQNPVYFARVSKIEPKGKEITYDIEVEGTHNFIANGLFVHNSRVTMKYPSIYLRGEGARAEILSVALASKGQHQDAGAKAVHLASNTTSKITSKSISKDGGRASYRGLLKVARNCKNVKSNVVCDALILDKESRSDTYPKIEVDEPSATIAHEARVGKIGDEQVFYLMSRGLSEEQAITMIVLGFISPFVKELPMEYAIELNRLIEMEMEGCVG